MKKRYIIAVLSLLLDTLALAQSSTPKNSIQAGIDYMSLDFPDDLGFRYTLRYARHLANDRLVIGATAGYLLTDNRSRGLNRITAFGNRRERVTGDLTVLVDFLKNSRHALRAGGGLSIWARQDEVVTGSSRLTYSNNIVTDVLISASVQRESVTALNTGWHATTEYEYMFVNRLTASGRLMVADLGQAGINSVAGVAVGYRF